MTMETERSERLKKLFPIEFMVLDELLETLEITVFSSIYCVNLTIYLLTIKTTIVVNTQCLAHNVLNILHRLTDFILITRESVLYYHAHFTYEKLSLTSVKLVNKYQRTSKRLDTIFGPT